MTDVFISYARADIAFAQAIAERLEREGFSVWWDRKIPIGEAFDEEIGEQLDKARGVVVLWSSNSIKSKWVKEEAGEGLGRKALFPVMLEMVRLPFGYRRVQTADFTDWKPDEGHAAFERLTAALKEALGGAAGPGEREGKPAAPPVQPGWFVYRWRRSIVFRIAALALPMVVIAAGAVAMTQMRVPTLVHAELQVTKIQFTVGGSGVTPVLGALDFASLHIERFDSVSFSPKTLRVAEVVNPDEPEAKPGAWRELKDVPGVTLKALEDKALQPWVAIKSINPDDKGPLGKLDSFSLPPGSTVTLERKAKLPYVKIGIEQLKSPLELNATGHKPFRLQKSDVNSGALDRPGAADAWLFEVENKESSSEITIRSTPDRFDLKLGVVGASVLPLLPKAVPITDVTLGQPDADGEWVSTLIADGTLEYPDHSGVGSVAVSKSDLVLLTGLAKFTITELELDPEGKGLKLRLNGSAKNVTVKTGQVRRDLRLTVLDTYRTKFKVAFWVTMIIGAVCAIWSAVTALRELRA